MKQFQNLLLIGLATALLSSANAADNEAIKKDMARFQGEWSMVSGTADGQPMPDEMRKLLKRVCQGDEVATTMAGQTYFKAKITVDPSKQPKTIDYLMTEGVTKGEKQLGIYEVDGDTFKSCFGKPALARKAPRSWELSTWNRLSPDCVTDGPLET